MGFSIFVGLHEVFEVELEPPKPRPCYVILGEGRGSSALASCGVADGLLRPAAGNAEESA